MQKIFDSNSEYHSSDSISASGLKKIYSQSVYYFLNQKPYESDAMKFGTAVHTLIYEGRNEFKRNYYFMPKLDLRLKANKAIKAEHLKLAGNKILMDSEQGRNLFNILANFEDNKTAMHYANGIVEQSHYLDFEGIPVRVRPDCHSDTWISDIKTSKDISIKAFRSEINFRNYDLQASFYCDCLGYDPFNFRFIAIRNQHPFDVAVYALNEDQIERGRFKYKHALRQWKHYLDGNGVLGIYSDNTNNDGSIIL
jgi:hypothetical protein